jgi:hypothetical protein
MEPASRIADQVITTTIQVPALMETFLEQVTDFRKPIHEQSLTIAEIAITCLVEQMITIRKRGKCSEKERERKIEPIVCNAKYQLPRDRFFLAQKLDSEIRKAIIEGIQCEKQEKLQLCEAKNTKEYRLIYDCLVNASDESARVFFAHVARSKGLEKLDMDNITKLVVPFLIEKAREYPHLIYSLIDVGLLDDAPQLCKLFVNKIIDFHVQRTKASRDRVINLQTVLEEKIAEVAGKIRKAIEESHKNEDDQVKYLRQEKLSGMEFSILVTDGTELTRISGNFILS